MKITIAGKHDVEIQDRAGGIIDKVLAFANDINDSVGGTEDDLQALKSAITTTTYEWYSNLKR